MNATGRFWLYLEPYSFIFKDNESFLVYNTLNSACTLGSFTNIHLRRIIEHLEDANNGYCVAIEGKELDDNNVFTFIKSLCESYSGNIINAIDSKPFIIKPICRIYNSKERMKEENFSLGRNVLLNLNEVSVYLPSTKSSSSLENKSLYYKQFLHNYSFDDCSIGCEDYSLLLAKLSVARVARVNIMNINRMETSSMRKILNTLLECNFKKAFYIDLSSLEDMLNELNIDANTQIVVHISSFYDDKFMRIQMGRFASYPIEWRFIASCSEDIMQAEQLQKDMKINLSIIPFFTGSNCCFFEEFVYNHSEDIVADPISKQTIFRRQNLNENFFGKLTILPSGNVYANLNCASIGNIVNNSLAELVYKEMTNSTAWFMLRDGEVCGNCLYKHLCPSISNYELALGKLNMCHVRE